MVRILKYYLDELRLSGLTFVQGLLLLLAYNLLCLAVTSVPFKRIFVRRLDTFRGMI
jgi:hypothetical protein